MHRLVIAFAALPNVIYSLSTNGGSTSSSNALALLNTAQLLRENRLRRTEDTENILSAKHQNFDNLGEGVENSGIVSHSLLNLLQKKERNNEERKAFISRRSSDNWTTALFDDGLDQNREDILISSRVQAQMPSIKSLRTSLGSEIPDMELHLQMEAARVRASSSNSLLDNNSYALAFMDLHHDGGTQVSPISTIEKIAMSSLPSQLPDPAATSFTPPVLRKETEAETMSRSRIRSKAREQTGLLSRRSKQTNKSEKRHDKSRGKTDLKSKSKITTKSSGEKASTEKTTSHSNSGGTGKRKKISPNPQTERVSHDEEIELARIIQRGVELHNIKKAFEEENHRDITRQEWTSLAELDSPKHLRRLVSDYRQAKNKLVMANMGLVHAVVRSRLSSSETTVGGISYEELVQEGSLGLLRAAELFDPGRGLRFSTYATIWIKGVLGNSSVSETITLPLREKNKMNKINKAAQELRLEQNGSEFDILQSYKPSDDEIAKKSGLKKKDVKQVSSKMKRAKNVLSLDYQYDTRNRSGTDNTQFAALANDRNLMDDVDLVERLQLRADIVATLAKNLDPREARLMRLRYGLKDGKTRSIRECAEAMGISRPRAQQLAMGCLKKLREADDAMSLQEYLLSIA